MLRYCASRCVALRFSFFPPRRCLIAVVRSPWSVVRSNNSQTAAPGTRSVVRLLLPTADRVLTTKLEFRAERQPALGQLLLYFTERGFAEVADFEQLLVGAYHQIADRCDAFPFEAVGRPHWQFQFIQTH